MNHWMFRCQDVAEKISRSMDGALPVSYRLGMWFHLMMCKYCMRFRRQLMIIRKAGRHTGSEYSGEEENEALSQAAKSRIKDKLRTFV